MNSKCVCVIIVIACVCGPRMNPMCYLVGGVFQRKAKMDNAAGIIPSRFQVR